MIRDDPRYIKFVFVAWGNRNGESFWEPLSAHKCTDDDWADFPPPNKAAADSFESIKTNPDRGMYCIDRLMSPDGNLKLFGNENNDDYTRN